VADLADALAGNNTFLAARVFAPRRCSCRRATPRSPCPRRRRRRSSSRYAPGPARSVPPASPLPPGTPLATPSPRYALGSAPRRRRSSSRYAPWPLLAHALLCTGPQPQVLGASLQGGSPAVSYLWLPSPASLAPFPCALFFFCFFCFFVCVQHLVSKGLTVTEEFEEVVLADLSFLSDSANANGASNGGLPFAHHPRQLHCLRWYATPPPCLIL